MAVAILMPLLGVAQSRCWRGFVDFHVGTSAGVDMNLVHDPNSYYEYESFKQKLVFGVSFTEGYQIFPYLFAGVGFGGYTSMLGCRDDYGYDENEFYAIYLPVYADFRWTLDIERTVTPFVDLKIGYQFGVPVDGLDEVKYKNGVYFVPSVGVRFGKRSAFNLGIAYNTSIGRVYHDWNGAELGKSNKGAFLLTLGADF